MRHRHFVPQLALSTALVLGSFGCHHTKKTGAGGDAGANSDAGAGGDAGANSDAGLTCGKLPPSGASQVVAPSAGGNEVGRGVRVGVDKAGRPILAYLDIPTTGVQVLYVQRWDDCNGVWRTSQKVDDTIASVGSGATVFALSVDPTDGRIALAYLKLAQLGSSASAPTQAVFVATSADDGATFQSVKVSKHSVETGAGEGGIDNAFEPNVTLGGGKTYAAWVQDNTACSIGGTGCAQAVVVATGTGGAYTYAHMRDSTDALHGGDFAARAFTLGLALDSAGALGVVAHKEPPTGYNTVLAYWRPGQQNFVTITDSANVQNDDGGAALVYDGVAPRVVSRLQQGTLTNSTSYDLVFSSSPDGSAWSTVAMPRPESIANSQSIVAHAGVVTVFAGGPHLFRTTNLSSFTVSDVSLAQGSSSTGSAITIAGKVWGVVEGITPPSDVTGGVVFYREP